MERDIIALEAMKVILDHQSKPNMTIVSKIKFFLGMKGFTRTFYYNTESTAKLAYEMADDMIKQSKK